MMWIIDGKESHSHDMKNQLSEEKRREMIREGFIILLGLHLRNKRSYFPDRQKSLIKVPLLCFYIITVTIKLF